MRYSEMQSSELQNEYRALCAEYEKIKSQGLKLDMSRGKPSAEQLNLANAVMDVLKSDSDFKSENGLDCRNYGVLDGIPECKRLFSHIFKTPVVNILVGGSSSLNMMYDEITRAMMFGVEGGEQPWGQQGEIKFLCPVPGYDRHFAICKLMGIKMINIPMTKDGPDMDMIESLVAEDESIKGIWCVPKYSNPDGTVYSDETVRRFAALKPKAKDFRIFWDNAYAVHHLYDEIEIPNLLALASHYGNENMPLMFTSTSKISFAGAGVAAMCASVANIERTKKSMTIQTIGNDKLNQLRHARYFVDGDGIREHMKLHAASLRPKFEAVLNSFRSELGSRGIATWSEPKGGYFISLDVLPGCAKRVYELAKEAGVTLTGAGAPFPYGIDPEDKNLRIAPSYPPVEELEAAVEVLCICVRMAAVEKLIKG